MYFTYVLYSDAFDRLYIGHTDDLTIRLEKHNRGRVTSTKAYVPWRLIHHEEFGSRSEAMRRERELKSFRGRRFIRDQILNR
ncbi:MAG: GIY-YIG nuclease family protein [Fidelibacterota bacterium]